MIIDEESASSVQQTEHGTMTNQPIPLRNIAPFFIIADLPRALKFYVEQLGFEVRYTTPDEDPFFAIVGRDSVQVFLKVVDDSVPPLPNHQRDESAPWDAFVAVADPDALYEELVGRGVEFHRPLQDRSDGLRGFEVADRDRYVLFWGRTK